MTENKENPSQPFNWLLFIASIPISAANMIALKNGYYQHGWVGIVFCIMGILLPIYFYNEILKHHEGFSKIVIRTDKIFKCRVSGTDEVFYLRADSEEEADLFFETTMEGKNVFIEESNIKLMGFEMTIPNNIEDET